ncbi:MAG TPA: hypothetical protein VGI70_16550, partial [Polyangiales bacterium]
MTDTYSGLGAMHRLEQMKWLASSLFVGAALLTVSPAAAQIGAGTLTGKVVDSSTRKPLVDVVVTATSPALQGEQTVVTDASG